MPAFNSFSTSGGTAFEGQTSVSAQIGHSQGILVYPNDAPKYVMTFSSQIYNRSTLQQVGTFMPSGYPGIVLPLPDQLINVNKSKWATEEAGILQVLEAGLGPVGKAASVGAAAQIGGGLPGRIGSTVATVVEAFEGATPNQFQVMLYRGPKYKQFQCTWNLSPQNFQEADIIRMICLTFQNAMAPTLVTVDGNTVGRALWGFPCVFRPRIYPNSKWMQKFKPCVCTNFTINYTPTGKHSFYRNTNGQVRR